MRYFKNTELAKLYNISEKSVRNWIQAAEDGKLDLELFYNNDRPHIANTSKNTHLIEQLVVKGRKYKNTRSAKAIKPTQEFYKSYSESDIFDIISNIDIHREIPHKYSYYADGAKAWDEYIHKLETAKYSNALSNTVRLFELNEAYIELLCQKCSGVNVIDIGVGNGVPVRGLLQKLIDKKLLRRYMALDTSDDMLDIAEQNIKTWFDDAVNFERYIRDANYSKFDDLLVADSFTQNDQSVINIVLFLGGTLANLRDPDLSLRAICNSLGKNDIFILTRKLDTPATRRYFDFATAIKDGQLVRQDKAIFDLLGIEDSFYNVEQFFDPEKNQRVIQIKLNIDLSIQFNIQDKYRTVELAKGDTILVWRATHQTLPELVDQIDKNDFDILQMTKSEDESYVQLVAKIKTKEAESSP